MIIGFTGTQIGMTDFQKLQLKSILQSKISMLLNEFHHGDCVGADAEAHDIAEQLGYKCVIHPPINTIKRAFKKADLIYEAQDYLVRNKAIVMASKIIIATPKEIEEQLRSGTWSTIRYAKKSKRELYVIYPCL